MSELTASGLWTRVLGILSDLLSEIWVLRNLSGSQAVRIVGDTLEVRLGPGRQDGGELEKNFGAVIATALAKLGAVGVTRVKFLNGEVVSERTVLVAPMGGAMPMGGVGGATPRKGGGETLLANLTFDQFVEGPSNQFAVAMAKYVATNPGGDEANGASTNPLFMYGPTGVGKTHLLHAIGNQARLLNPQVRVLYTTTEGLMNDYMSQWQNGRANPDVIAAFKKKYREEPSILLVDDIQYIVKMEGLQNEFFNIFNALKDQRRQIVMASDRAPTEIQNLMDRLVSRLQCGCCTNIDIPSYETRYNILQVKMHRYAGVTLNHQVIEFIAQRVTSSVRALEGALSTAVRYAQTVAKGKEETVTIAALEQSVLRQFIREEEAIVQLSCPDILETVCKYYGIDKEKVLGEGRERDVAVPRQIAMFLCRKLTQASLPDIGKLFHRKHSTVSYACTTIHGLYKNGDLATRQALTELVNTLNTDASMLD